MEESLNNLHYEKLRKKSYDKYFKDNAEQYKKELTPILFSRIGKNHTNTFMAFLDNEMVGFLTISKNIKKVFHKDAETIKVECIYIKKEYRCNSVATKMLNDLLSTMRNSKVDYEFLMANTYVDTSPFFLKNRFDYYKRNIGLKEYKNIIMVFKSI